MKCGTGLACFVKNAVAAGNTFLSRASSVGSSGAWAGATESVVSAISSTRHRFRSRLPSLVNAEYIAIADSYGTIVFNEAFRAPPCFIAPFRDAVRCLEPGFPGYVDRKRNPRVDSQIGR